MVKHWYVIATLLIGLSLLISCRPAEPFVFETISEEIDAIGFEVSSTSAFKKNSVIKFYWSLNNISQESIDYEGTPFVVIDLEDEDGNKAKGNPNGYEDYALGGSYEPGIINDGNKMFTNLKAGTYTMTIEVGWLMVNGEYLTGYGYEDKLQGNHQNELLYRSYVIIEKEILVQ